MKQTLRARVLLPITAPPVENGAVVVMDGCIVALGPWDEVRRLATDATADLGEVVLLPGLINAHCHLDYTDMAGEIAPTKYFTDWIKAITTLKAGYSYTEFAQSWLNGARMLLDSGTTTVADIEAVPELLSETWHATPLRVHSFLEMTGVKSRRHPEEILAANVSLVDRAAHPRHRLGLSPHAPYSTMPELLRLSDEASRTRNRILTTHVAESVEEMEMFQNAGGVMYEWLKRNQRDMSDCGHGSPVQQLARLGYLSQRLLAVHVNHLAAGDAALLGRHGTSVVHCPRSHAYFKHRRFPRQELVNAGVNVCLGTDSLATVLVRRGEKAELNMFEELRTLLAHSSGVSPETALRMATVNGARALGMAGEVGEITAGAIADLIAVPFSGGSREIMEAVVNHHGRVACSMIDGQWAIVPANT